ncbi:hypothetical protein LC593_02025 [Nostoc sp. CHAB 5844]|nr:hypothetical protein [Nostoc sp. CHAB 5844]
MILPSKFCELAGFGDRWQEKDLQNYIGDRLHQRGFSVQLEVKANGGRADIVTNWLGGAVVEVKKYLDRDTIYQASGQLGLYGLNNKHKLVVMGFLTPDANAQPSALKTASMLEQNPRIKVVFVNLEQEWLPGAKISQVWGLQWLKLPQLPKIDNWQWWLNLAASNPLIVAMLGLVLLTSLFPPQQISTPSDRPPQPQQLAQ